MFVATANSEINVDMSGIKSGGSLTVVDQSRDAFSQSAATMSATHSDSFFIGSAFFRSLWIPTSPSTKSMDGLGPLFNTNSCQSCHIRDGRGRPPESSEEPFRSIVVRLSIPVASAEHKKQLLVDGAVPDPNYGGHFNYRSIPGVQREGNPALSYREFKGHFADGQIYYLRKPSIGYKELAYGELHRQVMTSLRVAPALVGLGLLESIDSLEIEANADPEDRNSDGISGRTNIVWDRQRKKLSLGRFGWKASQPNLQQQTASAFRDDIGITSLMFPHQPCASSQVKCAGAPAGGQPEISNVLLKFVTFYLKTLAVPAPRNINNPEVIRGKEIFNRVGCALCHRPMFVTSDDQDFPALSRQQIAPYTDLLIHDMGEGLADGRPDFEATGREWRTAPLWGIGLVETVNGHTYFLHDGRARNLTEAILWHDGEAKKSKEQFLTMPKKDRSELLRFIRSL
ncbi:di-heme oxidoredictase family protein [Pseudomonadota bacterium]